MNVVLLVWIGIGGFSSALAGPLVLGSVWTGVTRVGALWGFWTGAVLFVLIHGEFVSGAWLAGTALAGFGRWFDFNAASPYSAAALAGLTAVAVTAAGVPRHRGAAPGAPGSGGGGLCPAPLLVPEINC